MSAPAPVRVRVPAKVNLHLGVGSVTGGYHDLVNLFHAVDLTDTVTVRPAEQLSVVTRGEGVADVPDGSANIAWRAAELLAEHYGVAPAATIEIDKAIPVAGGMAGGSADAAAALLACARLWTGDGPRDTLAKLAAELGSDVPFALMGGTALGTGRGEVLEPVTHTRTLHWVFALADFGISAKAAYDELDRLRATGAAPEPLGAPDALIRALRDGDLAAIAAGLGNDLQPACVSLAPVLRGTLDAGLGLGALAGIVSGSGPTCAFLCADADDAARIASAMSAGDECRTARAASGPVPGALVVS